MNADSIISMAEVMSDVTLTTLPRYIYCVRMCGEGVITQSIGRERNLRE